MCNRWEEMPFKMPEQHDQKQWDMGNGEQMFLFREGRITAWPYTHSGILCLQCFRYNEGPADD